MSRGLPELEVWFVTGSQRLYGDDVLRQVDEHAGRIAACLKRELRWNHAYYFLDRGV